MINYESCVNLSVIVYLCDLKKIPVLFLERRNLQTNMCFSNLIDQDTTTHSKKDSFLTSQVADDFHSPILPGLPDDVAKYCLALVPRSNFPTMGGVSKRWRSYIKSKEFITVRKLAGLLEEWLYVLNMDGEGKGSHWEVMDCFGQKHHLLPPMPGPIKSGFGVVVLNGKLLVIAGCFDIDTDGTRSATADVYQYDSCLNRFVSATQNPTPPVWGTTGKKKCNCWTT